GGVRGGVVVESAGGVRVAPGRRGWICSYCGGTCARRRLGNPAIGRHRSVGGGNSPRRCGVPVVAPQLPSPYPARPRRIAFRVGAGDRIGNNRLRYFSLHPCLAGPPAARDRPPLARTTPTLTTMIATQVSRVGNSPSRGIPSSA